MRTFSKLVVLSILLGAATAHADIVLIKKSQLNAAAKDVAHHRYDDNIRRLNHDSDSIADRIMNRDRYLAANKSSNSGDMQVKLIKK